MKQIILKTGELLTIREAMKEDARRVLACTEKASSETDFLTFAPGELKFTVEEEEKFLDNICKLDNSVFLVAEISEIIVGTASFMGGSRPRTAHTGEFGISILKEYWGRGIGTEMVGYLLKHSRDTGVIKKVNLRVRSDNKAAIHIYKKLGFVECGKLTRDLSINGKFYDSILMEYEIN